MVKYNKTALWKSRAYDLSRFIQAAEMHLSMITIAMS